MQPIVFIVDDDEAVRDSLQTLLEAAGHRVRSFASGSEFLAAMPSSEEGCLIIDVRMPGIGGLDVQERLRVAGIALPVIVITGHGDVSLAVEAMKIGAADFFEKPFNDDQLVASVRAALQQRQDQTKRGAERTEIEHRISKLSAREKDVLAGLIEGRANKQIAFDLGISPRTVEIYRANLMNKMQADSLSDLVRMALVVQMQGSD